MMPDTNDTIEVFISYSKQDKALRDGLLTHLRPLEAKGIITWHDRQILPGTQWDAEIKARLNAADIILLLLSPDFLATDYCTDIEIPESLRRHRAGATVMPIILRHCSWEMSDLAAIQAYPEKAKPLKTWEDTDEAYQDVVNGVYLAATELRKQRRQQQEPALRQEPAKLKQTEARYQRLEQLLQAQQWKEADYETYRLMITAIGKEEVGQYLTSADLLTFPCDVLKAIDGLWVRHSQGRFGFSVQKNIYVECGGKLDGKYDSAAYAKLGDRVGWRANGKWIDDYGQLWNNISLSSPKGILPHWGVAGLGVVGGWWGFWDLRSVCGGWGVSSLAQRLVKCSASQS